MTQANGKQQSAFSLWLRTGRLPSAHYSDGVELKFNPWHDPKDGQFTFSGAGRHFLVSAGPVDLACPMKIIDGSCRLRRNRRRRFRLFRAKDQRLIEGQTR